jgi:acyl carrier protein
MTTVSPGQVLDKDSGQARLYAVIKEVLGVEVQPEIHFLDLGGDSMDAVIIADMMVDEFGVGPDLDSFFVSDTVREIAERWWTVFSAPAKPSPAAT